MHMTSDIYFKNVIDLVLFTVVDLEKLRKNVWDEDLISPSGTLNESTRKDSDLALFVVTVPAKEGEQFVGVTAACCREAQLVQARA